jgi:hypothetical protein
MSESELDALARHLGHDVTTHRNNYRLYHATRELTVVSALDCFAPNDFFLMETACIPVVP